MADPEDKAPQQPTPFVPDPKFNDIAPVSDADFRPMMRRLLAEEGLEHAVRWVMPEVDYPEFVKQLLTIEDKNQFQLKVMYPFLEMLARTTTHGVSCGGLDNIKARKAYTHITNHRDIVLDSAFLNLCRLRDGMSTTEIAIGDNLLIYPWIDDLVRINRSFIVRRSVKKLEALAAARHLSEYIHYAIIHKGRSVWIAQREGRAKDSDDRTQEALMKMLTLGGDGTALDNLLDLHIAPVSISYEYDPNDWLKAREFLLRHRDPEYHKSQRDDLFAMETGLLGQKGRVHFEFTPCINDHLVHCPGTDRATAVAEACRLIDKAIHTGYKIFTSNMIAYDEYVEPGHFRHLYTQDDIDTWETYLKGQLAKATHEIGDVTGEELHFMRREILEMYSNPLRNKLAASRNEE